MPKSTSPRLMRYSLMFSTMLVMVNSNDCGMTQAVAIAALKEKDDDHKRSTFEEILFDRRDGGFDHVRPIVDRLRDEVFRPRTPDLLELGRDPFATARLFSPTSSMAVPSTPAPECRCVSRLRPPWFFRYCRSVRRCGRDTVRRCARRRRRPRWRCSPRVPS